MRDEHERARVVRQLAEQRHHLRLEPRVHAGGRLVEEQQTGPRQQLGGDGGALALTSRQGCDPLAGVSLQRELTEDALNCGTYLLARAVARQPQARRV